MSDEMKELRRRLVNDAIGLQQDEDMQPADVMKSAIYELDHLDEPYFGTDYSQGDGDDD
ncbi:hypothetical protein [Lactiplantibacillus plantarum]|uniref:hypothetical protein n=1 Tax=Lactiplantibacillus plantarum TaxID=1590 RepID=UPI0024467A2C|nr:hypothetical protein [Lactiplantibacillus plantarum]MDG6763116.1 hypothetical protein [Lactiplantibacillus plantarum]MDH2715330.1 hypothetical protein [Lactiplantibacillus plantarum]MDH7467203.1 hypothetical protein [Lactiplantibacillus plantarum]MDN3213958.1 hypothetical protein [Lactiplantibacillus plantarum]MDN3216761.1 hypothetical protein [Lactiplantibacillus plantarum]